MLFLFLGYEFVELSVLFSALELNSLTLIQIVVLVLFSVIVDVIPVLGYVIGKRLLGKSDRSNSPLHWGILLLCGVSVGLLQSALYKYSIITPEQNYLAFILSTVLFFFVALIPSKDLQSK